jgi:uncharacterized protein
MTMTESVTRTESLRELLDSSVQLVPGVAGMLAARTDGRALAYCVETKDPGALAALSAAALQLGQRLVDVLGTGGFDELTVRSPAGYVTIYAAGPHTILVVLSHRTANLARVHLGARTVATRITELRSLLP